MLFVVPVAVTASPSSAFLADEALLRAVAAGALLAATAAGGLGRMPGLGGVLLARRRAKCALVPRSAE
jgi:hypothetical protein